MSQVSGYSIDNEMSSLTQRYRMLQAAPNIIGTEVPLIEENEEEVQERTRQLKEEELIKNRALLM